MVDFYSRTLRPEEDDVGQNKGGSERQILHVYDLCRNYIKKKHMKIKWLSFGKKTVIGVQKLTILGEYGPNVHMKTP